jgi:ADP-heptose:LPS heptosyltransferase
VPRALVLHPGALGDVLLAVPALRALRGQRPADEVVLAAQPRIGRLLAALGVVDRHVAFDTLGIEALFADAPPPERLRGLAAGARVVSWFGSRDEGFTERLRSLAPGAVVGSTVAPGNATVWERLVESVGARRVDEAWRAPIAVPDETATEGRRALAAAGWDGARPLAVLHPGAGGAGKRWPAEGFVEASRALAAACGVDLLVHEGPADRDAAAALRAGLGGSALSLADPPLETLAGVLRHAALWLGNDSGVSHLAAAVGAPTLTLFVPANLAWRPWAPAACVRVVSAGGVGPGEVEAVVEAAAALVRAREARAAARGAG